MAYTTRLLVVANRTAVSDELLIALRERAEGGPLDVTLLIPASAPGVAGRGACERHLAEVLERWRAAGIEARGVVGDADPLEAVLETYAPGRYDEILVSTLPAGASRWLRADLPQRVARLTDALVSHVEAAAPKRKFTPRHEPRRERHPLGPLSVLAWGGPGRRQGAGHAR